MPPPTRTPRAATDDDGDALAALIAACFAEYPGCVFDRPAEMPELDAIDSYFRDFSGRIWVIDADDRIVGSLGVRPCDDGGVELLKVYVARDFRGAGLADELLKLALTFARERAAPHVELWSDTRFTRGHGFYLKHGFEQTGEKRFLADLSDTWEYRFVRKLEDSTN